MKECQRKERNDEENECDDWKQRGKKMTITIGNTYQSRALLSFPLLLLLSLIDDFLSMRVNTPSACINTCRSRFFLAYSDYSRVCSLNIICSIR